MMRNLEKYNIQRSDSLGGCYQLRAHHRLSGLGIAALMR